MEAAPVFTGRSISSDLLSKGSLEIDLPSGYREASQAPPRHGCIAPGQSVVYCVRLAALVRVQRALRRFAIELQCMHINRQATCLDSFIHAA
jgi:hypothetical protein